VTERQGHSRIEGALRAFGACREPEEATERRRPRRSVSSAAGTLVLGRTITAAPSVFVPGHGRNEPAGEADILPKLDRAWSRK